MLNPNQDYFQEENSWFHCIGDIDPQTIQDKQDAIQVKKAKILQQQRKKVTSNTPLSSQPLMKQENDIDTGIFKRERERADQFTSEDNDESTSNDLKQQSSENTSEQLKINKNSKEDKQHIYSKNYRERKRQHFKHLEQQNEFLKKKITDLQFRLRQKEMEINRLKFMPEQKQFTIEQLNEQFLDKVTVVMEKNKQNPVQYRTKYDPTDKFYTEFLQTYSQHGFGGTKKTELLNYYFNEILQGMLRDSERYLCLLCTKVKDGNSIKGFKQYEPINSIFFQILQPDEQKLKRLNYFQVKLHPIIIEFVNCCKQLYNKFEKTMKSVDNIHQFMKFQYPQNMDFARKRIIELEAWFEKHKYGKMMRNLRAQFLEQIKIDTFVNGNSEKKNAGTKKKKVVPKGQ